VRRKLVMVYNSSQYSPRFPCVVGKRMAMLGAFHSLEQTMPLSICHNAVMASNIDDEAAPMIELLSIP